MRVRWFCLGVLVGLTLAPAGGRATWRMVRDLIARTIDAALHLGSNASFFGSQTYYV